MGGGDAFYKQFDKIVKSINTVNYKKQNFIKSRINNLFAFSLIELSIVLIIIGLLVAGVTGGASLIESAKITSVITDMRNYNQALATFYSLNGYLPGDANRDGRIGYTSKEVYNANSFAVPYNAHNNGYGIPTETSGPIVELYLNKIIDFEPKNTNQVLIPSGSRYFQNVGCLQTTKGYKNILLAYRYNESSSSDTYCRDYYKNGTKVFLIITGKYNDTPNLLKKIDFKIDDGLYNSGSFRGFCGKTYGVEGYDSYNTSTYCLEALYDTPFYE